MLLTPNQLDPIETGISDPDQCGECPSLVKYLPPKTNVYGWCGLFEDVVEYEKKQWLRCIECQQAYQP